MSDKIVEGVASKSMSLPQYFIDVIQAERIKLNCSSMDDGVKSCENDKCIILETDDDDDSVLECSNVKKKKTSRLKYSAEQRSLAIEIYDKFDCKKEAMLRINQMKGFEALEKRKILRWKNSKSNFTMGRPISEEFEAEVMKECKSSNKNGSTSLHNHIKACAKTVLNREYWNEEVHSYTQKWLKDTRTRSLLFTSRWIMGLLARSGKGRSMESSAYSCSSSSSSISDTDSHGDDRIMSSTPISGFSSSSSDEF